MPLRQAGSKCVIYSFPSRIPYKNVLSFPTRHLIIDLMKNNQFIIAGNIIPPRALLQLVALKKGMKDNRLGGYARKGA